MFTWELSEEYILNLLETGLDPGLLRGFDPKRMENTAEASKLFEA